MATITPRRRKDGTIAYTAQIRVQVGGKTHTESKTLTDRKSLEAWVLRREAELKQPGAIERAHHKGTTIADVIQWYMDDFQQHRTFGRSKLSSLKFLIKHPFCLATDALALTPQELIQHAYNRAREGARPSTINNDFVWMRIAYRAVRLSRGIPLDLQVIDDATFLLRKERVISKSQQRDRRPTLPELNSILEYFKERESRSTLPMIDLTLFALFSTRRSSEVCRIEWDDLDRRRGGVLVRQMKHPQGSRDTFVILPAEAWAVVDRQPQTEKKIFPYNSKSVETAFHKACKFLEIEDLRYHDLRREGVSRLFELGWEIPKVAQVSGHKSWSSLQIYTSLRDQGTFDKYQDWSWLPS